MTMAKVVSILCLLFFFTSLLFADNNLTDQFFDNNNYQRGLEQSSIFINDNMTMQQSTKDTAISLLTTFLWSGIGSTIPIGNQLLARGGLGYQIYDISVPDNISLVGQTISDLYGNFSTIYNDYAYLLRGADGISWLDYSDPNNIFEAGHFQHWGGGAVDIAFMGDYAFIACGYYSGQIVDISNPLSWSHVGYIGAGEDVAVDSPYVYYSFGGGNSISIYDISNIYSPQLVGSYPARGDIKVKDGYCYIADSDTGLVILDVSNPANPQKTSIYPGNWLTWFDEVKLRGDTAFVLTAYYPNVIGIDVSNPYSPTRIGSISGSGYGHDLCISGNTMFLRSGPAISIDVSSAPWQVLDTIGIPGGTDHVSYHGKLASLSYGSYGIKIIDMSNPEYPEVASNFLVDYRYVLKSIIKDSILCMLTTDLLYILDISNPLIPDSICAFDILGYGRDMEINGDIAYVLNQDSGLQIIDIADPFNPQTIGTVDSTDNFDFMTLYGNTMYISLYYSQVPTIYAVDISDPTNPNFVGSLETGMRFYDMATVEDKLLGAAQIDSSLIIIDVSDPHNPVVADTIKFGAPVFDITNYLNNIIVSLGEDGLVILYKDSFSPFVSYDTPGYARMTSVQDSIIMVLDGGAITILNAPFLMEGTPRPDLSINSNSIKYSPNLPFNGQEVEISVNVRNNGFVSANDIYVDLASDPEFIGTIDISQLIPMLSSGADTTVIFTWGADVGIDTIYARVDGDNLIYEYNEDNNRAQKDISVVPSSGLSAFLDLAEVETEPGDTIQFDVIINNHTADFHQVALTVTGLESHTWSLTKDTISLSAGELDYVRMDVVVNNNCAGDTGLVNFDVALSSISIPAVNATAYGSINISNLPRLSNLLPENGQTLATNAATFMWETAKEATSIVYYRISDDDTFMQATGSPGISHTVYVTDLDFDTTYQWYAESSSGCGTSYSDTMSLWTGRGVVFDSRNYSYSIRRSYDQRSGLHVLNTDTVTHEVLVEVLNPYDDIIVGFTGDGSIDQIVELSAGSELYIELGMHAQDAEIEVYNIAFRLTSTAADNSKIYDYANASIHVIWPDTNFALIDQGLNAFNLVRSMRLENFGDSITDFNVSVDNEIGIDYLVNPQIEHAILGPGQHIDFDLIPTFEDTVSGLVKASCAATVSATGAGKTESVELTDCCDQEIFAVSEPDALICSNHGVHSWYCTNRKSIFVNIRSPKILSGTVTKGILSVNFMPHSNARPHDVKIYINTHLVAQLTQVIPSGVMEFDVDPSYLVYSSSGSSVNVVNLVMSNYNGGHYIVATNFSLCLCVSNYIEYICAETEADALSILEERPYLYEGTPETISITSPADGIEVPRWTGTRIEVDVQPAHGKYNVTAEIQYEAAGTQELTFEYDEDSELYYVNWLPNDCDKNVTITVSASKCGDAIFDNITVFVTDCDVPNIDLELVQLYFTNISTFWPNNYTVQYPRADTQYVGMVVRNNGETIAENVKVEFRVNDEYLGSYEFAEIKKDTFYLADTAWYLAEPITEGAYIEGIVDPEYSIADNNRSNNSKSEIVNIYYAVDNQERPFDLRTHAYGPFKNWKFTESDYEYWSDIIMDITCPFAIDQSFMTMIKPLYWKFSEKGGHCFGMANTSAIYCEYPQLIPVQNKTTFELTKEEATPDISQYHHYQLLRLPAYFAYLIHSVEIPLLGTPGPPSDSYDELMSVIKDNGQAAVMTMISLTIDNPFPVEISTDIHAVTAYKVIEFANGLSAVSIYENNQQLGPGVNNIWPATALFSTQGGEDAFYYSKSDKSTQEYLDYLYYMKNTDHFPNGIFPYRCIEPYYCKVHVSDMTRDICDYLETGIPDLMNGIFDIFKTGRSKVISIYGNTKAFIKSKSEEFSGFLTDGIFDKEGEKLYFVNDIPGCSIDTTSVSIMFVIPDSLELDFYIFGDSLDSAIVNYIDPSADSGHQLSFIQYEAVPVDDGMCGYLNLHDSATSYYFNLDNTCDQVVDDSLPPSSVHNYIYGDSKGDGGINILDVTYLINYLYKNGDAPFPLILGDANCSGDLNILDVTYIINYLYKGGPEPGCPE